jgi:prepilin-type N-terminal cleavage/methylation domain-containing protein
MVMSLPKAQILTRINDNRGFSIMELVVVVTLITALATAVLLMVQGQTDRSKLSSVANTARMINEAASVYRMESGVWPKDVDNSIVPPEIAASLPANLFRRDIAIGGRWDWNGPGGSLGEVGVSIRFATKSEANLKLLQSLDELVDDGDLNRGLAFVIEGKPRFYFQFSIDGN